MTSATDGLVSLGMYDLPELHDTTDAWWRGVRHWLAHYGVPSPSALERGLSLSAIWGAPDLLLAQTCGFPYVYALGGRVRYLATPVYDAPGCEGSRYCSALIVRAGDAAQSLEDLRGRRAAINDKASQSGMNALRHAVAPLSVQGRFFADVIVSGGHRESIARVREGDADVAAIDAVTWALLGDVAAGELGGLRVLGWTVAAPGLPLITAGGVSDERLDVLRRALQAAVTDPGLADTRRRLRLSGISVLAEDAYSEIGRISDQAVRLGYAELA